MSLPSQSLTPQEFNARRPPALHIYIEANGQLTVTDSDKTTKLYEIHLRPFSDTGPDIRVSRVSPNNLAIDHHQPHDPPQLTTTTEIGIVYVYQRRPAVVVLHGRIIIFRRAGPFSCARLFQSASVGKLTWKRRALLGDALVCFNDRKQRLAHYRPARMALRKRGKLELLSPDVRGALLEEVLVSALAFLQEIAKRR